jgi:hypothetical protein
MSIPRSRYLLATLLALLAARGLGAEGLDPWRGWIIFKQFAREVVEEPDPGVSVQITSRSAGDVRLYFLRQVLERDGDRFEPVGGVVCEFSFARHLRPPADWEEWSFDHPTFERFIDAVEQHPAFADLVTERPLASDVYWEDA